MSKRFGKKLARVEIVWLDSHGPDESGWMSLKRGRLAHSQLRIHSIGYPLRADKVGITLAQSVHDARTMHVIHIPRQAIVKWWCLKK